VAFHVTWFAKCAAIPRIPQCFAFNRISQGFDFVFMDDTGKALGIVVCVECSASMFTLYTTELIVGEYFGSPLAGFVTMPDSEHYRSYAALPWSRQWSLQRSLEAYVALSASFAIHGREPLPTA
jgi:hypothetical protein